MAKAAQQADWTEAAVAKIRHPKKRAYLAARAEGLSITGACAIAQIDRHTIHHWREHDETFSFAENIAVEAGADYLEHEARRRAVEGTDKPVYQGGVQVGVIREYSDTLLIFLLKGARPSKYRDNYAGGGTDQPQKAYINVQEELV